MIILAEIGAGLAILSAIGLIVGVVVLLVVVALFNRVMMPAREISRYADDILKGGIGITRGVDGVDELARTRELTRGIPELAESYLGGLGLGHQESGRLGPQEGDRGRAEAEGRPPQRRAPEGAQP